MRYARPEPLPLEAGHYVALIGEMERYLLEKLPELIGVTSRKDTEDIFRFSVEVDTTHFWIGHYRECIEELQKSPGDAVKKLKSEDVGQ